MYTITKLSDDVFENISRTITIGIMLTDWNWNCIYVNPTFLKLTGLKEHDLCGTDWMGPMQITNADTILLPYQADLKTQENNRWLRSTLSVLENEGYLCTVEDITALKNLYLKEKQKAATLQTVIENSSAGIFAFDRNFNYTALNRSHWNTTKIGRGAEIKIGDNYLKLAKANSGIDAQKAEEIFNRVMAGETVESIEQFGEPGLTRAWFSMVCNPLYDDNGRVNGMGVFCHNINKWMEQQEENGRLQKEVAEKSTFLELQTKRLESLNTFKGKILAIISHDLRQPLASVIMTAEMLKHSYESFSKEETILLMSSLKDTAAKSIELLEGLLCWVKSEKDDFIYVPKPITLQKNITEANGIYEYDQQNKCITLINEVADDMIIHAHEQMLLFINRNLISNATKYSPEGGIIKVSAVSNETEVIVSFTDHGPGMTDDQISKLFCMDENKIEANMMKGAGVALTICYDLVQQMNGRIWVDTIAGKGSVFNYALPLIP